MTNNKSTATTMGFKASVLSFQAPQLLASNLQSGSTKKETRKDWTRYADSRLKQFCTR